MFLAITKIVTKNEQFKKAKLVILYKAFARELTVDLADAQDHWPQRLCQYILVVIHVVDVMYMSCTPPSQQWEMDNSVVADV